MTLDEIMTASPEELRAYNKVMVKKAAVRFIAFTAVTALTTVAVNVLVNKLVENSQKDQD